MAQPPGLVRLRKIPQRAARGKRLVSPHAWKGMDAKRRIALKAFDLHLEYRARQTQHQALDGDEIFLTNRWVRGLLMAVGSPWTGDHFSREVISLMQEMQLIEDTVKTKRPDRPPGSVARAQKLGVEKPPSEEGGREAQPSTSRSYWWRVFRIIGLSDFLSLLQGPQGAYGGDRWRHARDNATDSLAPLSTASLLALLRRQGLVSSRSRRGSPSEGSVQWAFANSGPP